MGRCASCTSLACEEVCVARTTLTSNICYVTVSMLGLHYIAASGHKVSTFALERLSGTAY